MKDDLYIFLDIDGVLNTKNDWNLPFTLNTECLNNLKGLNEDFLKKYNTKYVLSSTWRIGQGKTSNSPQFDRLAERLRQIDIVISDVTPMGRNKDRQDEIEYYVKRHNISRYIILDDDEKLFHGSDKLYLTDYTKGLESFDIKAIRKMVKRLYNGNYFNV